MKNKRTIHSRDFLKTVGAKKTSREYRNKQDVYLQGEAADSMFSIQQGNVKLTVEGLRGKKGVVAILGRGDFFGEDCLVKKSRRWSTATTIQPSTIVRVKRETLVRLIRQEPVFAEHFISFLASRVGRIQEDLVALLFNLSEKRLARVLLSLDHFGKGGEFAPTIPHVDQETLAEMIGTTRSRVSHFMNRFRKLGFVKYDGRGLTIHGGLLSAVLEN